MKKHKRKEPGFPALLAIGAALSLGSVLLLALALSVISYFTKDPTSLTGALALAALVLGGGISGFVISRSRGEDGVLHAILSAAITALIIIVIGLIWRGGLLPLGALLNVGAFFAASALAALIGRKKNKRTYKRR